MKAEIWFWAIMTVVFLDPSRVRAQGGEEKSVQVAAEMTSMMDAYNSGLDLLKQGKRIEALSAFRRVLDAAETAAGSEAARLVSAAANNAGNILMLQGRPKEAETYFNRAVAMDPRHALAMNNRGAALLKQGKADEAIAAFKTAIETDPTLAVAYQNLAEILIELGQLRKAAEYVAASLELDPSNQHALLLLIKIYELGNLPEQRQKAWETLVKLAGDGLATQADLIEKLIGQESYAQADNALNGLLSAYPDAPEALLQKARLAVAREDWRTAAKRFSDLLARYPNNPILRSDLAAVLLKQGKTAEAETIAREGTRRFPQQAENWFVLGSCLEKQARNSEADAAYLRATEIAPDHAKAWNNLGVLTARQGQDLVAIGYFEKAVAADPHYGDALYNLGRALVISKTDYERGVRLLVSVGARRCPAAERARQFIADLETIAAGGDPGWKNAAQTSMP